VAQVLLRKGCALCLNDGIFGCLSDLRADIKVGVMRHRLDGDMSDTSTSFTLFGPTCDSADVLAHTWELPADTSEGDWVEFEQMDAYSNSLATHFKWIIAGHLRDYRPELKARRSFAASRAK